MTYTDTNGNHGNIRAGGQVIINGKVVQDGSSQGQQPTRQPHSVEHQTQAGRRQSPGESPIHAGRNVIIGDVVHGNVKDVVVPGDRVVAEGKGNTVITTGLRNKGNIQF